MSMKKSSDTIWNRTRDLPACSAVPQATALPHALSQMKSGDQFSSLPFCAARIEVLACLYCECGCYKMHRNVGTYLPIGTAGYPRILESSKSRVN